MGKFSRRAIIGAATFAGAIALSPVAIAADDTSPIDVDGSPDVESQSSTDVWRFAEEDRVGTSLEAAERTNRDHWGDTAIIATSGVAADGTVSEQGFADALSATPLADLLNAPVLLNNEGHTLDSRVASYLADGDYENVVIIGGDSLFSESFVDDVEGVVDGDIERIYGANRYETSVKLAYRTFEETDAESDAYLEGNIFLASGTDFADAMAAGAAAAENDGVVLLTNGWDGLYNSVYDFAVAENWSDWNWVNHGAIYAIGGPAADSALEGNPDGEMIEVDYEIVGDDRYETATETAERLFDDPENITIASGLRYPDAVVGGSYAANADGPLLLTRHTVLDGYTADYLMDNRSDVENVFVFGGPGVITQDVSQEIADLPWDY